MKKWFVRALAATAIVSLPLAASADELHGRCIGKGGEKCQNHHRISTSWNSRTASIDASAGTYRLDLGGTVDKTITVYCDGKQVGKVKVKGSTKYTVDCR